MFHPEASRVEAINLLTADKGQLKSFGERVRKNNGSLDILVHASYAGPLQGKFPITDEYRQVAGELINQALKDNHPLLVFESIDDHPFPRDLFDGNKAGVLYFVPTLPAEPTPAIFGRPSLVYAAPFVETFCWNKLGRRLQQIGVRQVNVGGRYMLLHPPDGDSDEKIIRQMSRWAKRRQLAQDFVDSDLVPDGCPGAALYFLTGLGFDVSISTASSPTNKMEPTNMSGLIKTSEIPFF